MEMLQGLSQMPPLPGTFARSALFYFLESASRDLQFPSWIVYGIMVCPPPSETPQRTPCLSCPQLHLRADHGAWDAAGAEEPVWTDPALGYHTSKASEGFCPGV